MSNPTSNSIDDVASSFQQPDVSDLRLRQHRSIVTNTTAPMPAHHQAPDEDRQPQPQLGSRLLALPTELRLMICSYMTLSPRYSDSLAWKGAYFTCRQLHKDMRDELKPQHDLTSYIASNVPSWFRAGSNRSVTAGVSHPQLELIRDMTIHMPIPWRHRGSYCRDVLSSLYTLYLNHLNVIITGPEIDRLPCRDLKSWDSRYFIEFVAEGRVHCKKVTFTIDVLANKKDGRHKSVGIANVIPGTKILYLMEIVQDKAERQTERVYSSEVRFRPLPLKD